MESSKVTIMDVWSSYCEIGNKDGRERPVIRGLEKILTAKTSATRIYNKGDKGHPWQTLRDNAKKEDK